MIAQAQAQPIPTELYELLESVAHAHSLAAIRRWQVEVFERDTRAPVFRRQMESLEKQGLVRRSSANEFELTEGGQAALGHC